MDYQVMKDSKGRWCVAVPSEPYGYGAATGTRVLKRIPISRDAPRDRAEYVAHMSGLMGPGAGQW